MFRERLAVFGIAVSCLIAPTATASPRYVDRDEAYIRDFGDDGVAIIYWIATRHGFEVITTLNREDRTSIRITGTLLEGQSQTISMPMHVGRRQPTLVIVRLTDTIMVDSFMEADNEAMVVAPP